MLKAPIVHGFAINPPGGPDIFVEGTNRFVREDEFLAYKAWADTALATAVARARREAMEEAAEIAESQIDQPGPYSSNAELARADTLNAGLRALASDLRAVAATPPEARQTETGDDRATVLLGIIEAARAEVAFAAADEADGTADQKTRRVRLKSITAALNGVGDVQARRALGLLAPPDIGNLEGEGRDA